MVHPALESSGLLTGFQAHVFLWLWVSAVILHGALWRSLQEPAPDPVRSSGPIE
jgi:hypothetical protein